MRKMYSEEKARGIVNVICDKAKLSYIAQPRRVSVHSMPELRLYDRRVWISLKNRLPGLPEGTENTVFEYINALPQTVSDIQERHAKDIDLMYAMLAKNKKLAEMSAVPCDIQVVDENPLSFAVNLMFGSENSCVPCATIGPEPPDRIVKCIDKIHEIYMESVEEFDKTNHRPKFSPRKCPHCGSMNVFNGYFPFRHCGRCGRTFRYRTDTVVGKSTAMEFHKRFANPFKEFPSYKKPVLSNPEKVAKFVEWVRSFDGKVIVKFVSPREESSESTMIAFFYNNGRCKDGNYMEELLDHLLKDAGFHFDTYSRAKDTGYGSLLLIRTVESCSPNLDDETRYGKYTSYGVAVSEGEITPLTTEDMYIVYNNQPPYKNETYGNLPKALRAARERRKEDRKKADFNRRFEN